MKGLATKNIHVQYESIISSGKKVMAKVKVFQKQSSKDSTSPMSETCKIRTGQVKFQDHKPN